MIRLPEDLEREKEPWKQKSDFSPCPGESEALEKFLTELQIFLFNPENRNKFKDNLSADEREALRDLQKWNKDPDNPRVISVQDKGSRFVVDWKKRYISKTLDYLQYSETFSSTEVDPSEAIAESVQSWADKWEGAEGITREVCDWIKGHSPGPANVYEQPFAQQHTSYIKDTQSFSKHLEHIDKTRAPLSDTTRVLQTYPHIDLKVQSIAEALEITMSSNNTKFGGRFFTQSNGATIGGPESASVTDIFGATFIDSVAKAGGPLHW